MQRRHVHATNQLFGIKRHANVNGARRGLLNNATTRRDTGLIRSVLLKYRLALLERVPYDSGDLAAECGDGLGRQVNVLRIRASNDVPDLIVDSVLLLLNDSSFNFLLRATSCTISDVGRILLSGDLTLLTYDHRDHLITGVNGVHAQRAQDLTYGRVGVRDVVRFGQFRICLRCLLALVGVE